MSQQMLQLQKQTDSGKTPPLHLERREIDYGKELEPVKLKTGENAELQVRGVAVSVIASTSKLITHTYSQIFSYTHETHPQTFSTPMKYTLNTHP